jgi:hypothetical protein
MPTFLAVRCPRYQSDEIVKRGKLLAEPSVPFPKPRQMHDIAIGLFVKRYAFGRAV